MATNDQQVPLRFVVRAGVLLTLVMVVVGSVRFARFDWTGLPITRGPLSVEKRVSPNCLEHIRPYVTESGRVIKPVVIDEMQYMSIVEYLRGAAVGELQVECLYSPFTERPGVPWLAHWIPGDEGVAIALVNSVLSIAGMWLVLATLRSQGARRRPIFAAGILYAVSWNYFFFGTSLLLEASVVAAIAACWYLISTRRFWSVWPVVFVGASFKETIVIVLPVLWVSCWRDLRERRSNPLVTFAPALTATAAYFVGSRLWASLGPDAATAWESSPDFGDLVSNLVNAPSLVVFALGTLPLVIPAWLVFRREIRSHGLLMAIADPATIGVASALAVCGWSLVMADLSPRFFWIGYPFAASMAASWFSQGRPSTWLGSLDSRRLSRIA